MHAVTSSLPPTDLPVEAVFGELRAALAAAGQAVLTAEPGAGKTTLVPLRLLNEPWLAGRRIVMLEPRRMAARAAARRMAHLLGEQPGQTVGWITRDDRAVSDSTRILVVTEGVLTAWLVDDPALSNVGMVIFDEFHERSLPGDTGLALFLLGRLRNDHDTRLLVMSATINADAIAAHLGGAPVVTSPGRTFPVEVRWRPRKPRAPLVPSVVGAVREALKGGQDVLVFLPGVGEIRQVERALTAELGPDGPTILPLHGSLPAAEQDAALLARTHRRIVLATNIAETSLTVEGIGAVVDSGLERVARYDPSVGMNRLRTVACSRASAEQRAGRAGRLGPGIALRLWSKADHASRPPEPTPAIVDEDLSSLALDLARRGLTDPGALPFLTAPSARSWERALALLQELGAIDEHHQIAERGRVMAALPVHPRLARMVVEPSGGWLACVLAAVLDDRDLLRGRPAELPVDLAERVRLVVDPDADHPAADGRAIRQVRDRARQLAARAGIAIGLSPADAPLERIGAALAPGFVDRIARSVPTVRGGFVTADGRALTVSTKEQLAEAAGIVAIDIDPRSKRGAVHRAARLEARLDHLVYATPDLDATVAMIIERWGVTPSVGGRHEGLGTRNVLLAIGAGAYLEVVGPDPDQPRPDRGRPFGVDTVTEPRLVTWAAAVTDLDLWLRWCEARRLDAGSATSMSRLRPDGSRLTWRLAFPPDNRDGVVPFLIEWQGDSPATTAASGLELLDFSLSHRDSSVGSRLAEYALPKRVEPGPCGLRATLLTPAGVVELSSDYS